jgi:hypothetical protein
VKEETLAITLLDMLLNARIINREQFEEALRNRVIYGGKIGTSLIELGYVGEEDLARFLSNKLEVPYVHYDQLLAIPPEVIALLPRELALKYGVIPLSLDKKRLNLVMADPADLKAIDEIGFITGYIIRPHVTPEIRLIQALGKYYQTDIDFRFQSLIDRIDAKRLKKSPAPAPGPEKFSPPREADLEEAEIIESADLTARISRFAPDEISKKLAMAGSREEIVDIVMDHLGRKLLRVALFIIRDKTAVGWKGVYRQNPLPDMGQLKISLKETSAMKTVADDAGLYLGPLPYNTPNRLLLEGLGGGHPDSVLIMPLIISGRIVNILYAEGEENLGAMVPELQKLLLKAALAFESLICREKILML